VLVALGRYLSVRYWIEEGNLVIRTGLVDRQVRTIPLDRIQNVELRQGRSTSWSAWWTSASRPPPARKPRPASPCSPGTPPSD
jgi:hypothetical protein